MPASPPLGTASYVAGLQCARRLWLRAYRPELAAPAPPRVDDLLRASQELATAARTLFAGGIAVGPGPTDEAAARSARLLADPTVPAIFGACFEGQGVALRVDVLERRDAGGLTLCLIKSALRIRDEHLDEAAFQLWCLRGLGLEIGAVEILHPNSKFVRGEGEIDWQRYFARHVVTPDADFLASDVRKQVDQMRATLDHDEAPEIEPSPHCRRPYPCPFLAHCTAGLPDDWIGHLPGLRAARFHALRESGRRLCELPDDAELSVSQRNARESVLGGRTVVSAALPGLLRGFGPPSDYVDFEAIMPEAPIYPGTSPFQTIPFQWSLHLGGEDALSHQDFLATGDTDPRRGFAESLVAALAGRTLPILVYSGFEATVVGELADVFPDLRVALRGIRARLRDLLPVVRAGIYAPGFRGSFSLKRVAPLLAPEFGYDDLEGIADGGRAAQAYLDIVTGQASPAQAEQSRAQLLRYCERDTLALVALHRDLQARCEAPS